MRSQYYHWLKLHLRKLDISAILLIVCYILFIGASIIEEWIVVCVPFISSSEELLSLKEELQIIPELNSSVDSLMCLHFSFYYVKLTIPYSKPHITSLDAVISDVFVYIRQVFSITGLVLILLVIHSVATLTVSSLPGDFKKFRKKVLLFGSLFTGTCLSTCLILLILYKEKKDFYSIDVIKLMLVKFTPTYGISFYICLIILLVNIFLIKTAFFLQYSSNRKHENAIV